MNTTSAFAPPSPEVFVSYAREDKARSAELVAILEQHGSPVFWDERLVTGQEWLQVLQERLDVARAVVVLWSSHSIASRYVIDEAQRAADAQKLVPVRIDESRIPLGFGGIHAADLTKWDGQSD